MTITYVRREKQIETLGKEVVDFVERSSILSQFLLRKRNANENTAKTYKSRLYRFGAFIYSKGNYSGLDSFIAELKEGKFNVYDILAEYSIYLKKDRQNIKNSNLKQKVKIAKRFLRFAGVHIDNEDFRDFVGVGLPKAGMPEFKAAEKDDIIRLLTEAQESPRLKTVLMACASTGCRILELCAARNMDVDLDNNNKLTTLTFRAEYTKTKTERTRPITPELASQIKTWQEIKYRPHRNTHSGETKWVTPEKRPEDLLFATWWSDATPEGVMDTMAMEYSAFANRLKIEKVNGRRTITFHRLRAFVYSTILGYSDYANWYIGHAESTYYRRSEKDRRAVWDRIAPYLTFVDVSALSAQQKDIETQLENTRKELQELKERQSEIERQMEKADNLQDSVDAQFRHK